MAKLTPTQKKDRFLKYTLYFTILLLGVAIGIAARHYYNIPMIESLNIIDIATLIVTVFLAIYIPGVFDRRMEVRQEKKELLGHRIGDLQNLYRNVNMTVQLGDATEHGRLLLVNSLDVAANRFNTIVTLLEYLALDETFREEISVIRSLITAHGELLHGADVSGGAYSEAVRQEEERLFNSIDKQTSLLVFRISDI